MPLLQLTPVILQGADAGLHVVVGWVAVSCLPAPGPCRHSEDQLFGCLAVNPLSSLHLRPQGVDVVQRKEMLVDLVVGCRPPQISQIMFLCLNNASITFDGRVRRGGGRF